MGEVVGAGLLAHVPTIMLPRGDRAASSTRARRSAWSRGCSAAGRGLRDPRLRHGRGPRLALGRPRSSSCHGPAARAGLFTSDELPRGMCRIALRLARRPRAGPRDRREGEQARHLDHRDRRPVPADALRHHQPVGVPRPGLPDKRWISVSISAQTGDTEDFAPGWPGAGRGDRRGDRKVLLIASGALSHTFWPLRELRDARGQRSGAHLHRPRPARPTWSGSTGSGRATTTGCSTRCRSSSPFRPEAKFAHYLMMVAALGEAVRATRRGRPFSEYENSVGTGQMHLWFDRPARGWYCGSTGGQLTEYRRILLDGAAVQVAGTATSWSAGTAGGSRPTRPCTCRRSRQPRSSRCTSTTEAGSPSSGPGCRRRRRTSTSRSRRWSRTAARWSGPRTASTSTTRARSRS